MSTNWTTISSPTENWTTDPDVIPLSPTHKTYNESGLIYNLTGNYYDWGMPKTPTNEDSIWSDSSAVTTVWT